ncbi:NAD(P)-dependent oxidoreductase [Pedobacter yulinensis]|uniref:NAD(P)-dependent oxidoreductase n=1 Tax=Pedobacter yulinensis TaxID=2126353 RepID=A0A2T3HGJ1_9SPHI|nr:glucose 1-dehydrogenase [Pedobacter yulinensis]PST81560.1 NAD(P)-dependent oxidoreductase [Pedobacter yulinensis]
MKKQTTRKIRPAQTQTEQPGKEADMRPDPDYQPRAARLRLERKVAIITGGDSGIGRAVALAYAKEGADVVISYLNEDEDAKTTEEGARAFGARVLLVRGDISDEKHCKMLVDQAVKTFGRLDILVNNAAVQYPQESLENISAVQLHKTFSTNIFAQFYLCKAALPHLREGANIICTTSVTAYRGSGHLIDYASTKGAIVSFVRSLSASLAPKNIRVNGVAPGPVWTPLIPSTFPADHVAKFGSDVPLGRAAEPSEIAPAYVFLGSDDASYMTGQIIHPNGGEVVNA